MYQNDLFRGGARMKKLSYLIFLAFSCLATSCNAKSEKEIDINLSSVFGYYDSYSDTEKTLTILNGTTVSSLPKPQPIFPEVYTFKGYGLNRTNDSILPNDYVVKNNETLYAKFDRELKSNETFIFYDASSVTKEEPEKNIIGIQAGLLKEEGIEQNFKIECSDPNCNFYFEIEDLKKSILSFGIIIDENYCGPVVFKITCPMNFMALCEVKGELSSDKIDQKIFINGKKVKIRHIGDAIKNGLCYLSEDRRRDGMLFKHSLIENSTIASLNNYDNALGIINDNKCEEDFIKINELISTKYRNGDQYIETLSGGNQQKVLLSRWLLKDSDILILDEPTRGIDVGAKDEIYEAINQLVKKGKSIIVISSEGDELKKICDRILVVCEGRISADILPSEAEDDVLLDYATD